MTKKTVVAIGGNALGNTPEEQQEIIKTTAKTIVNLAKTSRSILVVHGNGPQVGMIDQAMATSHDQGVSPHMPFGECGAMSQGYIGYHLQKGIDNRIRAEGLDLSVVTVVTQTLVDRKDPAFDHPTKPIGVFLSKEEYEEIKDQTEYTYIEDSGRGYRRVVPSPQPIDIIEKESIQKLIDPKTIVIAGGGGGIPVVDQGGQLYGIEGVIDKDHTAELLADIIDAEELILLTAVDQVAVNFGTKDEEWLKEMNIKEARTYLEKGEFGIGSMEPKVKALIQFVEKGGQTAIISSLEKADLALQGQTGTRIVK